MDSSLFGKVLFTIFLVVVSVWLYWEMEFDK